MEFTLFSRKICFAAIYAVLSRNLFCRNFRTFCVETTYGQNVVRGEKMTNIMYDESVPSFSISGKDYDGHIGHVHIVHGMDWL